MKHFWYSDPNHAEIYVEIEKFKCNQGLLQHMAVYWATESIN